MGAFYSEHYHNLELKTPSRHFNDSAVLLGIGYKDISGLALFLTVLLMTNIMLHLNASPYPLLGVTFFIGVCLVPIRINYRKKIVRDSFKYFVRFYLGGRVFLSLYSVMKRGAL